MRARRFEWEGAGRTAARMRSWSSRLDPQVDVDEIFRQVVDRGDAALAEFKGDAEVQDARLLELTNRFDCTELNRTSIEVDRADADAALAALPAELRAALDVAAANVRAVAEAQLFEASSVELPQGQKVTMREVPVGAAGIYAPGGRASYPSSVLMCAIPARVAGVERIALATPPGPYGGLDALGLAAAALCEVDEIYAMGGAQAIFALAFGTETIAPVDVIAGPGNAWVREAKRAVYGTVGIDSLAGPSELMVVVGHDVNPEWAALDLCSQAEHGPDSPLVAVAVEERVLGAIEEAVERAADVHDGVEDAPFALVQVPDLSDAIDLANAYAPEHLELLEEDAALLADQVATAFGDYAVGSNHVLPTGGAGRFSGPLGPAAFRRRIATVEIPEEAAEALAPYVDALARAEGFPVHAESAMIRAER